ncbi:MAG: pectate lyase [Gammaproteobacteria bacterium]|nr:pectate lyase [Gammaproteobacteria bacterium]
MSLCLKNPLYLITLLLCLNLSNPAISAQQPNKADILQTMKRASVFMVDKVSYQGGYLWSYLPDFSRRWGELEARESMIWVQPPGTASMGHLFLDAYHISHDEYYYQAAQTVAAALIKGQHPSGGWNYLIDFAGEESVREWYDTIGRNGWRLEEFHHYYGNATFDDAGTAEAARFLLRLYLEKTDKQYKTALDKAIGFVLSAQYPNGGWPQRYPPVSEFPQHGHADYTPFITFNDDVAAENIDFLIFCYRTLNDKKLLAPIIRAMNSYLLTQMPQPQSGWAMQYSIDLKPAVARSYEPAALSTSTTAANVIKLMEFYQFTGDKKFIQRIPEALDWLDSVQLPKDKIFRGRTHPTYIELTTNKPLYLHRKGSNVANGKYYIDYNPEKTIIHYGSTRQLNVDAIRKYFEKIKSLPADQVTKNSPLFHNKHFALPLYFTITDSKISDMNSRRDETRGKATTAKVHKIMDSLNAEGYWPTPLRATSNPYIGQSPEKIADGDFSQTLVGDQYDTSPYFTNDPAVGISTGQYIYNMSMLIEFLLQDK